MALRLLCNIQDAQNLFYHIFSIPRLFYRQNRLLVQTMQADPDKGKPPRFTATWLRVSEPLDLHLPLFTQKVSRSYQGESQVVCTQQGIEVRAGRPGSESQPSCTNMHEAWWLSAIQLT